MLAFALTIFLGAFLLFQVQPMIGKFVLPWFGGSPLAWATCMLFFQLLLLGGYGYAHLIVTYLAPKKQARVHFTLLLLSFVFLPIIPSDHWKPAGDESAVLRILLLLTATIGAPFLLLSATGPLMQAWFSRSFPGRSPYRLYSLSNIGSLLALISYPFLIEPAIALKQQTYIWSVTFGLFALCCGWCAYQFQRQAVETSDASAPQETASEQSLGFGAKLLWILLPAAGSLFLLATTNKITQDVAVVPFLWILPLCIYLVTFIIAFDNPRWYWRPFWAFALMIALIGAYIAPTLRTTSPILLQVSLYSGTLFICCMICHGELVRLKPPARQLTSFYLAISLGGALGGVFVNLVAPMIFLGFWEYRLGAGLCLLLFLAAQYRDRGSLLYEGRPRLVWAILLLAFGGTIGLCINAVQYELSDAVVTSRSFYGVLRVDEYFHRGAKWKYYELIHGRISHGQQFQKEPFRSVPNSYYGPASGVGIAQLELHRRTDENGNFKTVRTGVIGLGAGVMATYGFEGDTVRFYEIDQNVINLSQKYFSFTRDCPAKVDVILGDARISMEREQQRGESQQFDILVLDAFSGDGIPLHLLTKQAFELYNYHLKSDGVLAVHISNRYLDLRPLVRGLAQDCGKQALWFDHNPGSGPLYCTTEWILVTSAHDIIDAAHKYESYQQWNDDKPPLLFTDDYSNLFKLLRRL